MTDFTPAKLRIIADADLRGVRGSRSSPARCKAVLTVLAAHEGAYISIRAIADRTCLGNSRVVSAMNALRRMGVLRSSDEGYHRMKSHGVNWRVLAALAIDEPLYRRGGTAPRRMDAAACARRVREARYRERRRKARVRGAQEVPR